MIKIEVDESYAFDFLTILEIKYDRTGNVEILKRAQDCRKYICEQLGEDLAEKIFTSDEYKKLKSANNDTFDFVDKAKTDMVKASDVDYSNLVRFNMRKNLLNKFFSTENNEVKIGYEVYKSRN